MKCPGQDSRFWEPGAIFETECPHCGHAVEFFKDESSRKCKQCGHKLINPRMDFGCASYCKYAEQCLGELPPELLAKRDDLLKDRVAVEMKRHFGRDFKRIGHAMKVARYAEQIVKEEKADPAVVLPASFLRDIGAGESDGRIGENVGRTLEGKASTIAREILARLGARQELIEEVCDIIARLRSPGDEKNLNVKCLLDADRIVSLEEEQSDRPMEPERIPEILREFHTETGRELARAVLKGKC